MNTVNSNTEDLANELHILKRKIKDSSIKE